MHSLVHLLLLSCVWPVDCSRPKPQPLLNPQTLEGSQPNSKRSSKSVNNVGCLPTDGIPYAGNASTTENGHTCQMWSEDTPHNSSHPEVGEHNYCRSPDGDKKVWCYTTDPGKQREYCNVPSCETHTKGMK